MSRSPIAPVAAALAFVVALPAAAASYHVGTVARRTSVGQQVITHGLGTTPKALLVWTANNPGPSGPDPGAAYSIGLGDDTEQYSASSGLVDGVSPTQSARRVAPSIVSVVSGDGTLLAEANLTTLTATTFTLDWTTADATAAQIHYVAFGGAELSAKVVSWSMPGAPGDVSVTSLPFRPDLVLSTYLGSSAAALPSTAPDSHLNFAAMDARGQQWAYGIHDVAGVSPPSVSMYLVTDAGLALADGPPLSFYERASWVSMDPSGFTVNFSQVNSASAYVFSLALAGAAYRTGFVTKDTSLGPHAQPVTSIGFTPQLVLLGSIAQPAATDSITGAVFGLGASDGVTTAQAMMRAAGGVSTSSVCSLDDSSYTVAAIDMTVAGVTNFAHVRSLDPDGFTLFWGSSDSVPAQIVYVAVGTLADAGMSDAGTLADAGMSDAGMSDAGVSDAGTSDAGTADASVPDAGPLLPRSYRVGCGCGTTSETVPLTLLLVAAVSARRSARARAAGPCGRRR